MKRILFVLLAAILLLSLPVCVTAEEERETLQSGDFSYAVLDDGTVEITGWYGSETTLEIPSTLDGKKVTRIEDRAFPWCDSLTAVTIPDSVSEMGANPFIYCAKLTSINVSPTHPYFATIDGVLYEKATKKLVCYPYAFTATEFAIPQGIAVIGDEAFSWCSSLTTVTIPDSVTTIGNSAFHSCYSLTAVTIPNGVTTIGNSAFAWCSSLTAVTIPDSVTSIGDYAFIGCKSLTAVTIPDSVTSIGDQAFSSCDNLTLTVPHDSYAEAYCKENGLRYIYPETNDWLFN